MHGKIDESGTLRVDNTILRSVATCDTQAIIRHVLGYTSIDESRYFASGRAGHAARAEWHRTRGDVTKAMLVFDAEYKDWAEANIEPDDRLSWSNVRRCTERWLRKHTPESFPLVPVQVEQTLETPLTEDGSIVYVLKMDLLGEDAMDQSLWVCDTKTTGRITMDWKKAFRNDSQLTGYVWGAQQIFQKPVVGAYIDAVEYARLPSATNRKCKEHGVLYSECGDQHATSEVFAVQRTPEQLRQWRTATAIPLARRYRALCEAFADTANIQKAVQQGTATGACPWCFANEFCGISRPVDGLATMFQLDRWDPKEVA